MKYKSYIENNNFFDNYKFNLLTITIILILITSIGKILNLELFNFIFNFILLPILLIQICITVSTIFLLSIEKNKKIKNLPLDIEILKKLEILDEITYCSYLNNFLSIDNYTLNLMRISFFRLFYTLNDIKNLKLKINFEYLNKINKIYYYNGKYFISEYIDNTTKIFVNNYLLKKRTTI